jgi:hypothetical protein
MNTRTYMFTTRTQSGSHIHVHYTHSQVHSNNYMYTTRTQSGSHIHVHYTHSQVHTYMYTTHTVRFTHTCRLRTHSQVNAHWIIYSFGKRWLFRSISSVLVDFFSLMLSGRLFHKVGVTNL